MQKSQKYESETLAAGSYIVSIGASAGGLEALTTFFENTPIDTGFSFIILQHLSPDHKSLMAELLAKHTAMKVIEAEESMLLMPNSVYLLPSKKFMTVKWGKLKLHEKFKSHQPNNAIDVFFESAAEEYGPRAIGIVLSGTGSDGSKGLEAIKANEGIAIVQDPITASFDGMPNSAISTEMADLILPPEMIMSELLEYLTEPAATKAFSLNTRNDETVMREILMQIRKATGHDFGYYKRPTLYRRLSKRLSELNIHDIKQYLGHLNNYPEELKTISQEFLINVTRFFRDTDAYDILKTRVIPAIMKGKTSGESIKIWSVACSTGEEPYSIAMLFQEYMEKNNITDITVKIFATDIDRAALETASQGVYSASAVKDVSRTRLGKFFNNEGDKYKVTANLRRMVVFSFHDILKDPPFSRVDMISCRNMLIYINSDFQKDILQKLHFALNLDGYLFLGPSEDVGATKSVLEEIDKKWRIYKCISKARLNTYDSFFSPMEKKNLSFVLPKAKTKNALHVLSDIFADTLAEQDSYAGIFIDQNMEVKQATGNYKQYISLPETNFNFNLMKLVPADLGIALSVATRKALKDHEPVTMRNVTVHDGKATRVITLTVKPYLQQKDYDQQFIFIVLKEEPKDKLTGVNNVLNVSESDQTRILELETELKETRANLQAVIEEVETANEELQSSNEEMLSTNEELQSTNEELQSLNEELHTVSAEHQQKIKEMMELNDDMNNYFKNSDIGQILIDRNLMIRKFSPAVTRMVNLIDADVNRSIMDITTKFADLDFISDIRRVMIDNHAVEKEITLGERFYLMRITPYIRQDRTTDGTVVNFIDVTEQKKAADIIERSYEELKTTTGKLRSANVELEQSNMDLVQFASVASHDLKEPLRKIQTYGNILYEKIKDKLADGELANLNKIIAASDRMQRLIEDVLTFSKLSNRDLKREKVNLKNTITRIMDDLEITVLEKKSIIHLDSLPVVAAVPGQMHQLFQNLLSNAMKFSDKDKPEITISEKILTNEQASDLGIKPKNYICVSIRDNGIGFEEQYRERIFGIFQRLNGSNYEGTGIGLAVCKKIVENHGGFLFAESKPEEGAEFFVVLPKK